MKNKVVIVGCGNVGMSYAYSLVNQRTSVNELVLIDVNKDKALGEAMDLNHSIPYSPSKIKINAGDYSDCSDAKIIVIAAGVNQKEDETRMDLIYKNSMIFKDIIKNIMESGFNGIFIIATNPVDILTYKTYEYSGLDKNKVIGTGTILDTARLRYELSDKLEINSKNIHAYVLGEHGDSEFISWSNAYIGVNKINNYLENDCYDKIENRVKNMAYDIIKKKGNTSYGIGMALTRITNAILGIENTILTISSYDDKNNIYYGWPTLINNDGVVKRMDLELNNEENIKLNNSINIIKDAIEKVKD